jgi:hypothetical protein
LSIKSTVELLQRAERRSVVISALPVSECPTTILSGGIRRGSVAVTRDGRRCGKGEGYSDLEFAILRELGHPPVPVATTVHDLQVVDSVPRDPTDQPLSVIATPTHAIRIKRPSAAPTGIDWTRLSAEDLEEMPILAELRRMTTSNA